MVCPYSMSWLAAATRIGFLVILAALLGWYYGYPWAAVIVTMVLLVAYWLYQLRLIQLWLNDPCAASAGCLWYLG